MCGQGDCSPAFTMDLCNGNFSAIFYLTFLAAGLIRNALKVWTYVLEKKLLQNPLWPKSTENFSLDHRRYGCPVTAITVENLVKAKSQIKEDPRITHLETQDALGI